MKPTTRVVYCLLLLFAVALLAISFVLQFGFHLEPCPLCIIDRVLVLLLAVLFSVALLHQPKKTGQIIYSILGVTLCTLGILVTARQLWIAHLPHEQIPVCTPGLQYLFNTLSPKEAIMIIFKGSAECAENNSTLWGVSLPAWTMIAFIALALGIFFPWMRKK